MRVGEPSAQSRPSCEYALPASGPAGRDLSAADCETAFAMRGVHFTWGEIHVEGAERGLMRRLLCSGVLHDCWGLAFVLESISAFLMVLALRAPADSPAIAAGLQ